MFIGVITTTSWEQARSVPLVFQPHHVGTLAFHHQVACVEAGLGPSHHVGELVGVPMFPLKLPRPEQHWQGLYHDRSHKLFPHAPLSTGTCNILWSDEVEADIR